MEMAHLHESIISNGIFIAFRDSRTKCHVLRTRNEHCYKFYQRSQLLKNEHENEIKFIRYVFSFCSGRQILNRLQLKFLIG